MLRALPWLLTSLLAGLLLNGCGTASIAHRSPGPPRGGVGSYSHDREDAVDEIRDYCRGKGYRVLEEGSGNYLQAAPPYPIPSGWIKFECRD